MRILLTGASGMIGKNLTPLLESSNHQVVRLLRSPPSTPAPDAVYIDFSNPDLEKLSNFNAVIHLAGENIAQRWTNARKQSILASRYDFTSHLTSALAKTANPPSHFLSASGIGYYGYDRPETLTESSSLGQGFLADVCQKWEAATAPLQAASPPPRIAIMRIAAVLSTQGGALAKLLTPFKLGAGGVMGTGRQIMSWIALPDLLAAIQHILNTPTLTGPINLTSPHPVTNRQFTKTLGQVLHRPTILKTPAAILKLAFGQMATETILANQNAIPQKLLENNFHFEYPHLEDALKHLLNKTPAT